MKWEPPHIPTLAPFQADINNVGGAVGSSRYVSVPKVHADRIIGTMHFTAYRSSLMKV